MKKVFVFAATLCITVASAVSGFSQDSTKQLLSIPKITSIGLYVAPEYQYGQLKGGFTSFGGASAMVLFNKTFGIGIMGMRSLDRNYSPSSVAPLYLSAAYGGLKMEYTIKPNSIFHLNVNLLAGCGAAHLDSTAGGWGRMDGNDRNGMHNDRYDMHNTMQRGETTQFVVLQPGLQAEANLFKYVKLFAGANYRFAIQGNQTSSQLPISDLKGFSGSIGLKIGLFDFPIGKKEVKQ